MKPRRRTGSNVAVVLVALVATIAGCGVAFGHFSAAVQSAPSVGTIVLEPPASASTSTADGCATIVVSWVAAVHANSYRIQVQVGGGAWTDLTAEAGDVLQTVDGAGYTATNVGYRVFARDLGSGWESSVPVTTEPRNC
ncbi:MAG: hypothetical protein JWM90_636 [Thermoleophilia bacterium]|nr:hypothetical protein [Thermoleophilia bacterium]